MNSNNSKALEYWNKTADCIGSYRNAAAIFNMNSDINVKAESLSLSSDFLIQKESRGMQKEKQMDIIIVTKRIVS
jgi:hypothetical protein